MFRKLCLTYLDVYKLDMALPYAVHDKKGKAAYDKTKKVLKVTLPVQAVAAQSVISNNIPESTPSLVSEVASSESVPSPSKAAKKKSEVTHDRWVKKDGQDKKVSELSSTSNPEEEELDESKKLFLEVQKQAELAKKKLAEQQEQLKSLDKPVSPKKEAAPTSPQPQKQPEAKVVQESPVDPNAPSYIECASFMGRKLGYVFKRGDEGLGYYLDKKSSTAAAAAADSSDVDTKLSKTAEASQLPSNLGHKTKVTSSRNTTTAKATSTTTLSIVYQEFKFDIQQNKDTVAFLFQVANIIPTSVQLSIDTFELSVSFAVLDSENATSKKHYGMTFQLDEKICIGGLDAKQAKHDIASKNMVLVVTKQNREDLWECEDGSDNWITSKVMPTKEEVVEASEVMSSTTSKTMESTTTTTTSAAKLSTANTVKSVMSTMKFSTDFISELD